jgi:hypothetical protein
MDSPKVKYKIEAFDEVGNRGCSCSCGYGESVTVVNTSIENPQELTTLRDSTPRITILGDDIKK